MTVLRFPNMLSSVGASAPLGANSSAPLAADAAETMPENGVDSFVGETSSSFDPAPTPRVSTLWERRESSAPQVPLNADDAGLAILAKLRTFPSAAAMIEHIEQDLDLLADSEQALAYLQYVSQGVEFTPLRSFAMSATQLLSSLHFVGRTAEGLSAHVTLRGLEAYSSMRDTANLIGPLFRKAIEVERRLQAREEIGVHESIMVADLIDLYARKNRYYCALYEESSEAGYDQSRMRLAATFLYLAAAQRRYEQLGQHERTAIMAAHVETIAETQGIEGDPLAWSFEQYHQTLQGMHTHIEELRRTGLAVGFTNIVLDLLYRDCGLGLTPFSPELLQRTAAFFRDHKLPLAALKTEHFAQIEHEAGEKLGLLS